MRREFSAMLKAKAARDNTRATTNNPAVCHDLLHIVRVFSPPCVWVMAKCRFLNDDNLLRPSGPAVKSPGGVSSPPVGSGGEISRGTSPMSWRTAAHKIDAELIEAKPGLGLLSIMTSRNVDARINSP